MAKNEVIYRTLSSNIKTTSVLSSTPVQIFSAGANGSKILSMYFLVGSSAESCTITYNNGTDQVLLSGISSSNSAIVDVLAAITPLPKTGAGQPYFNVNSGDVIKLTNNTATANATIVVVAEDY